MLISCATAWLLLTNSVQAQWPSSASPFVPAGHWSYAVLRRLDDAGLLPRGADVARRSLPQEEIAELLSFAAQADTSGIAAGYLRKLREEFKAPVANSVNVVDATLLPEYHRYQGRVLAGIGYDTVWTGARPLKDASKGGALARLAFASRYAAGAAAIDRASVHELQFVLSGPVIGAWIGRRELGYATARGGGLVLDEARLDAVGVLLTRPLALPLLGPIRFETQLAQIDNVLHFNDSENAVRPFFWSARGSFEPWSGFRIGVNRGMIFGGQGNYPVTASRVLKNLIGIYTSGHENAFANQVISADLRYRLPTGSLPAAFYVDWAADDAFGGWWHTPAIVAGLELSPFRRGDALIGVERTEFARNTRTNSLWYQNAWFRGSWADDGAVLGNSLGGHGTEWRAFTDGGSPTNGWNAEVAAYLRNRGSQNLFAPQRAGRSTGGKASTDIRLNAGARLELQGEIEHGTGAQSWTTSTARAGIRYRF